MVSTTLEKTAEPAVELVTEDPVGRIRQLKAEEGAGIWLVGGGALVASLVDENSVSDLEQSFSAVEAQQTADLFDDESHGSDEFDPGRTIMDPRAPIHFDPSASVDTDDDSGEFDPLPTVLQLPKEADPDDLLDVLHESRKEPPPLPMTQAPSHWQTAALVAALIAVLIVLQQIAG